MSGPYVNMVSQFCHVSNTGNDHTCMSFCDCPNRQNVPEKRPAVVVALSGALVIAACCHMIDDILFPRTLWSSSSEDSTKQDPATLLPALSRCSSLYATSVCFVSHASLYRPLAQGNPDPQWSPTPPHTQIQKVLPSPKKAHARNPTIPLWMGPQQLPPPALIVCHTTQRKVSVGQFLHVFFNTWQW